MKATLVQATNSPPPTPFFSIVKTKLDVPQIWRDRGQDWIDEWLWRANRKHFEAAKKQSWNISKELPWHGLEIDDVSQQKWLQTIRVRIPPCVGQAQTTMPL